MLTCFSGGVDRASGGGSPPGSNQAAAAPALTSQGGVYWTPSPARCYAPRLEVAAERLVAFKEAFAASIARRRLTPDQIDSMLAERARVDAMYREWIKTVSPEDVGRTVAVDAAAAALESLWARGYRTPHR
ncbi:MAG: hypothetical protein RI988_3050 [Pseudomonadota bacterium]